MLRIGRYQNLEEIGRGAMGVVYRAQDPAIGRVIAIKTIRLNDLTDLEERQRLRERLFREAQSAGILSHPNIVTIYDIAEEDGQACIFMEFVNGPPFERLLSGKDAPDKQSILDIFRQTAVALDYAHRKGIVHRDIKPANIMIHDDGQAKIADFGVAKILSQQMTQSGNMMGTPSYMSPEQVQGFPVDGRADQFGLAVMAYEILTGEKPFSGDYLPTLLYKIVREDPPPPQRFNPSLTPSFEAVLRKGLAKNPPERFATCTEFMAALTEVCRATPGWVPMPRGASQNLPTLAGNTRSGAAPSPLVGPAPPPAAPNDAAPRQPRVKMPQAGLLPLPPPPPERTRNPLVRSLIWVLLGIGLVGLVVIGSQRILSNSTATATEQTPPTTPPEPAPDSSKPSPSTPAPPDTTGQLPGDNPANPPEKPEEKPEEKTAANQPVATPPKPEPAPANEQPSAPQAKNAATRSVQLITDPPGAKVILDGDASLSCQSPCMLALPVGRHALKAQLSGYRDYLKVLNVPQDSDVFLKLAKAVGTLSLTSSPPGASIHINGEQQSKQTPAAFDLPPGDYRVKVTRNGVPLEFSVQIHDGEIQARDAKFQ